MVNYILASLKKFFNFSKDEKNFKSEYLLYFLNVTRLSFITLSIALILSYPIYLNFENIFDYPLNKKIFFRVTLFISFISVLFVDNLFNKFKFNDSVRSRPNLFKFCALLSLFLIISYFSALFYFRDLPLNYYLITLLFFLFYFFINHINIFNISTKLNNFFLALLILLSILLPVMHDRYINYESGFDVELFESYFATIEDKIDYDYYDLKLTNNSLVVYKNNLELISYMDKSSVTLDGLQTDSNNTIKIYKNSAYLSSLCLLIDKYNNDVLRSSYEAISSCLSIIRNSNKFNLVDNFKTLINSFDYKFHDDAQSQIFGILKDYKQNSSKTSVSDVRQDTFQKLLSVLTVRGAYIHHFNSIGTSITENLSSFFSNQYSFGPLFLSYLVKNYLNFSTFDSIFFATVLINLLILAILFLTVKFHSARTIYFGYALSIIVTFGYSQFMAPFLYGIRYFPLIILCLLFYLSFIKGNEKHGFFSTFLIFLLLSISAIYAFEYSIILGLSLIFSGFYISRYSYSFYGFYTLLLTLIIKFYISSLNVAGNSVTNVNYLAYISGIGRGDELSIILILAIIPLVLLSILLFSNRHLIKQEIFVIYFTGLFMSIKIVWIGAINHIASLFLIFAFVYDLLLKEKKLILFTHLNLIQKSIFYITLAILLLSLFNLINFNFSNKINQIEYEKNSTFSEFFYIDSQLSGKLKDFSSIYKNNDLVISPIDNALSIYTGKRLTSPYPDLSTNINSAYEINNIVLNYVGSNIIVDKRLLDLKTTLPKSVSLLIKNRNFFEISSYQNNIKNLNKVYKEVIDNSYVLCDESKYFTKYCFDNT